MTLDITVEQAQLHLDSKTPDRQTSYVKLRAGGRECNTVIGHGSNPVWTRQTFRASPQEKFLFEVCFPSGSAPQPYSDQVFARGVFDFSLFASKSELESMDDTSEVEARVPLESGGREAGVLVLRVKYIVGKIHIGGLHPFSQMDLTFDDMASKVNEGSSLRNANNLKGSRNYGAQAPPSQFKRTPPSNPTSKVNPSQVNQFNAEDNQYLVNGGQSSGSVHPYPPTQTYPVQSSQGPYPVASFPQQNATSAQRENPTGVREETAVGVSQGRSVGGGELWTLTKGFADKLNIFSFLDSGKRPFELAPPKINSSLSKSNMRQ